MKSKILENKRIKKERLIDAAYSLFSHNDLKNVSIQDIVTKAGVAKGTFYLYFKKYFQFFTIFLHFSHEIIRYLQLFSVFLERPHSPFYVPKTPISSFS